MGQDSVWVQIVPLYNGGRYSAYVFRRFTDVRLVAAVELNMGFFGGDPDNFTYPRYALDFAFLRVYGRDGEPYEPSHYFTLGTGVEEGDPVFIIGNPGSTNRLQTVAQLEYQRDVQVPALIHLLASRHEAMGAYRQGQSRGSRAARHAEPDVRPVEQPEGLRRPARRAGRPGDPRPEGRRRPPAARGDHGRSRAGRAGMPTCSTRSQRFSRASGPWPTSSARFSRSAAASSSRR